MWISKACLGLFGVAFNYTHTQHKKIKKYAQEMKSMYDTDELFEIERTLVETIASSLNELNIDGTRKKVKEYFNDNLLPEVLEEMSVIQRCNK